MTTAIVLAKKPRPGHVKSRLVPPLTFEQAADIAAAALRDTLAAVDASRVANRVLAFDADPAGWLPPGWRHARQPARTFDGRLVAAFGAARRDAAVLVGMDTPQLRPAHVEAFDPVRYDACLGPASDGGYWTIGFADPRWARAAISGVPMSTPDTGAEQLRRLRGLGLRVQLLETLTDVDTVAAADEVALLAPETAFAAALAGVRVGV